MSKPMPAHHSVIDIRKTEVADGYGRVRIFGVRAYIIVAAAPPDFPKGQPPPAVGYIRVIVAPARVPT